jgi:hypothetical protein
MAKGLLFNKEVRLHIQKVAGSGLTILAAPKKGEPDEEDTLQAVEIIANELTARGVNIRTFKRNTATGDRIDMISTSLA